MGQKSKIKNFIVRLVVSLLVIISFEVSLRIWSKFSGKIVFSKLTIDDRMLDWRLSPNYSQKNRGLRINSRGFRGREFDPVKKPGSLRIVALGDSCTFGAGSDGATYPELLEEKIRLSANGLDCEVINAGVPGYTSRQCLLFFKNDISKLKPDVLIVYCGWNNIWTYHNPLSNTAASPQLRGVSRFLAKSLLFSLFRGRVVNPVRMRLMRPKKPSSAKERVEVDEKDKDRMLGAFAADLNEIISSALDSGSGVIVITLASPVGGGMEAGYKNKFSLHPMWREGREGLSYLQASVNAVIMGLERKGGLTVLDFDGIVSAMPDNKASFFFSDAVHPNDKGNDILAGYLYLEALKIAGEGKRIDEQT